MSNDNVIFFRSNDMQLVPDSRRVEGYAVVFESLSERLVSKDGAFYETIKRGAITDETIKRSDVFAKFNHADDKILARSLNGKGSLSLNVDDIGVRYSFEAPRTALGDELLEHIRRGEITTSSFAFTIDPAPNSIVRYQKGDGRLYHDVYKIDYLYDVSPVFSAAYSSTSCNARSLKIYEDFQQLNNKYNELLDEINLW